MFSLMTGLLVGAWVYLLGIDYPVLWGLLAFFFNFVPNIGSIIAAVPAVLLALLQYDLTRALLTAAGYLAINLVLGNLVEPRIMGKGLGLSTLIVFISLVFWGWVLGPIGMLFSVPLTMVVKIVLENFDQTRWVAILLSANPDG
jgi:AI-2 transport protein TqsA